MKFFFALPLYLFLLTSCNQPANTAQAPPKPQVTDTLAKPTPLADSNNDRIREPIALYITSAYDDIIASAYPYGEKKLKAYILQNKKKFDKKYHTFVRVWFDVDTTGLLRNFKVENQINTCPQCNEDALQLAKQMPNWIPAYKLNEKGQKDHPMITENFIKVYY